MDKHPRYIITANEAVDRYIKQCFPGATLPENQRREIMRAFAAGAHWGMERFAMASSPFGSHDAKRQELLSSANSIIDLANSTLRPGEDPFISY